MARKKMFTEKQKQDIIIYYLDGFSTTETGNKFGITGAAVYYILKQKNINLRSVAVGNSLKWENKDFRNNQVFKKTGKPSGALGKTWKMSYKVDKNNKGEKNPMWKGGKTKLSFTIRNSYDYSFWRIQIFKRDKYTCQICGAKNKKGEKHIFDADHIDPFSKILDDFKIKNIEEAISCKELWDITNGRTLCRECHKKTDTWGTNLNKNA